MTLHSYRYAWAERAKTAGYPERFAQEALGHNSKAVHRAYARHAEVTLPSLEEFEAKAQGRKIVRVGFGSRPQTEERMSVAAAPATGEDRLQDLTGSPSTSACADTATMARPSLPVLSTTAA